ncbi:ExbD/TolR family protein [Marinigracilibium pacificum]|uniref:Biopolymer transporter ExbD n=1 Tax=Marinigracilibium pacificum TaxID=2729599 RepID=A0A848J288_9BACT|nr:biopolymer transporter ExbD [Marinigracilibium pacificum]NMM50707.1 biopolymer transporter ExbD [Marinigracilibium pacificum]
MSKFRKRNKASQEIPTAALPDIIFMLLFFFMVTTVIRQDNVLVDQKLPTAKDITKLERKSLVSHLYIGKPKESKYGEEPLVQANDAFVRMDELVLWVTQERDKLDEVDKNAMTVSLKVDRETKMGLVSDVQQELREANALKIMYNTPQFVEEE